MHRMTWFAAALIAAAALLVSAASAGAESAATSSTAASAVVVPRGQPVQIAFVGSSDFPDFTQAFRNAIQLAIESHPMIRGFPIQINEFDPACFSDDFAGANVAAANAVVSNPQNTAVIGHVCSVGFAPALPIYESADVVTISGSATADFLPSLGPDVFNRTAVEDPDFESWYGLVTALPSDLAFQQDYQSEFGAPPQPFTDLYFDAASLLLSDLQQVSRIVNGNLVIDRAALASAVRNTTNFEGVTCTVTLDPLTGNRIDDPASLARCAEG
jgi:ABC-type branched-subunit amino acid transport system substrate-binding protein